MEERHQIIEAPFLVQLLTHTRAYDVHFTIQSSSFLVVKMFEKGLGLDLLTGIWILDPKSLFNLFSV